MTGLRAITLALAANAAAGFQTSGVALRTPAAFTVGSTGREIFRCSGTKLCSMKTDENTRLKQRDLNMYSRDQAMTENTSFGQEEEIMFDFSEDIAAAKQQSSDENDVIGGLFWRGVVVILCALWASNFPAAKLVMAEPGVDSSLYAVARFGAAALALAPGAIAATRKTGMDMETLKGSIVCGSWVAFGYLGQTLGLLETTASRSCVICSLHCVFVAMVAEFWRVSRETAKGISTEFDFKRLIPAAIAVAGVAVIELKGAAGDPTIGDLLSFAQPIGFGLGYLQLEALMAKRPDTALAVSAIKLGVVALASMAMFEITPLVQSGFDFSSFALQIPDLTAIFSSTTALSGIIYTGLLTTALALWVESKAFAKVPATDASIILTTEPLMAAAIGAFALGETFGLSDYAGASLIIGACIMATLMGEAGEGSEEPMEYDSAKEM